MSGTRRGVRDWVVDSTLFLAAFMFGLIMAGMRSESGLAVPQSLAALDQLAGAFGCLALWARRRWPVRVAVTLAVLASFSETISGAMLIALFSLAVHRPPRASSAVFGLSVVSAIAYTTLRPEPGEPPLAVLAFGVTLQGAALGWGLWVRYRRQLLVRGQQEAVLRVEQAQLLAREQIAREMHDVLGHRLSLLSVHAGALEFRPDATPEEIAGAAGVIRESAHQALQDLRAVIGVLRAPSGELPQPTWADVRTLIAESEQAGMRVRLRDAITDPVPERVGRTAYRIIQEALTNARKHAPGSHVAVWAGGGAAEGLTLEIIDTPAAPPPPPPRAAALAGRGLIGLTERVNLAGGRLDYGPSIPGRKRLGDPASRELGAGGPGLGEFGAESPGGGGPPADNLLGGKPGKGGPGADSPGQGWPSAGGPGTGGWCVRAWLPWPS